MKRVDKWRNQKSREDSRILDFNRFLLTCHFVLLDKNLSKETKLMRQILRGNPGRKKVILDEDNSILVKDEIVGK